MSLPPKHAGLLEETSIVIVECFVLERVKTSVEKKKGKMRIFSDNVLIFPVPFLPIKKIRTRYKGKERPILWNSLHLQILTLQ